MPDALAEAPRAAAAFAAVGCLAAPVYWMLRGTKRPPVAPWRPTWTGADAVLLAVLYLVGPGLILGVLTSTRAFGPTPPAEDIGTLLGGPGYAVADQAGRDLQFLRVTAGAFGFLPLFLAAAIIYGLQRPTLAEVRPGILAWAVLTPATFAVHFAALGVFGDSAAHPLTRLGVHESNLLAVLLLAQACVAAPVYEELIFRRFLLPWAVPRGRAAAHRPAVLVGLAAVAAAFRGDGELGPVLFGAAVVAGYAALRGLTTRWPRFAGRNARGVYATAALFAAVHSAVWPSPVPLFVLGLGLGWVTLRTKGVAAAIVAHGLFNAVSAVVVLCGPG